MTNRDVLIELRDIVEESTSDKSEALLDFLDYQIESIDIQAERMKGRNISQDEIRSRVLGTLTSEYQPLDVITAQVDESVKSRAISMINRLHSEGLCKRSLITEPDGSRVMGYRAATEEETEEYKLVHPSLGLGGGGEEMPIAMF